MGSINLTVESFTAHDYNKYKHMFIYGGDILEKKERELICLDTHSDAERESRILSKVPTDDEAIDASELFSQLSCPTRIRLLSILALDQICVCELAGMLGISQPAVSHHLRMLRQSGFVRYKKLGKQVQYSIADSPGGRLLRTIIQDIMDRREEDAKQ